MFIISRYGPHSMDCYEVNLQRFFYTLKQVIPKETLVHLDDCTARRKVHPRWFPPRQRQLPHGSSTTRSIARKFLRQAGCRRLRLWRSRPPLHFPKSVVTSAPGRNPLGLIRSSWHHVQVSGTHLQSVELPNPQQMSCWNKLTFEQSKMQSQACSYSFLEQQKIKKHCETYCEFCL